MSRDPCTVVRVIARLNIGGPAIHVTQLTARLDPARYRSVLVSGREAPSEGNMYALARSLGVTPVFIETLGREISPWSDLRTLWTLYRLMRRLRPGIVHTHTAKAGTLGRLAAILARVPLRVHTFHGHTFHGYFGPRKTRVFLAIERWLARRTHAIIGVSQQVCDDLLALGIGTPDTVHHIPLGLDLARFAQAAARRGDLRQSLGMDAATPLVGIVARLAPIKRLDLFVEAARRVHAQRPDARFVLVGDGALRASLEERVTTLGLKQVVRFAGWWDDLVAVYADLDVVALTSDNEGLPVCLIEAMAAGCPIVATNVGGVRELVHEGVNGHVVAPGDADALAQGLLALLDDPQERRAMGAAGRDRALRHYGVERLVRDVDALYTALRKG